MNEGTVGTKVAYIFELEMSAMLWAVPSFRIVRDQAVRALSADDVLRGYHLRVVQGIGAVNKECHSSGQPLVEINTLNVNFLGNGKLQGVDMGTSEPMVAESLHEGMAQLESEPAVRANFIVVLDEANGSICWPNPLRRHLKERRKALIVQLQTETSRKRLQRMAVRNAFSWNG